MAGVHQIFMVVFILLFITRASGSQTSPDGDDGVPVCTGDQRTLLSILWSCLATIFACTWLAVHPNVPAVISRQREEYLVPFERAKIIAITILVPEIIVAWAAEQFIVAMKLCHGEYFISSGVIPLTWWTTGKYNSIASANHPSTGQKGRIKTDTGPMVFFLCMGGFYTPENTKSLNQALEANEATSTLPPSSSPSSVHERLSDRTTPPNSRSSPTVHLDGKVVLSWEQLSLWRRLNLNHFWWRPSCNQSGDNRGQKQGDALSKTVSILQISWFIMQCIARAIQHLPITLLEMTALAYAGLSMIMYFLWWYKPLNVKYHISLDALDSRPADGNTLYWRSTSPVNPSWQSGYSIDLSGSING